MLTNASLLTAVASAAAPHELDCSAPPAAANTAKFVLGTARNPAGVEIAADGVSILENGRAITPVMGEFHYTRYPRAEWRDELQYVTSKTKVLAAMIARQKALRLTDLTAGLLEAYLASLDREGLSAGWCNYVRRAALAFANWCVADDRMPTNMMTEVNASNEKRDRRYQRRAYTDDELARLLAVAEKKGRKAWYLTAALAGLRCGRTSTWQTRP